jgi:hypothetical protein
VLVALAVASQESRFFNYANDGQGSDLSVLQQSIVSSLGLPHDQVGSDWATGWPPGPAPTRCGWGSPR